MQETDFSSNLTGKLERIKSGALAFTPDEINAATFFDSSSKVNMEITRANDHAVLALGQLRLLIPSLPNPALLTTPFMRREAVLSSKIEGTKTELPGLFLFEEMREDQPADGKSRDDQSDAQEVLNYVMAQELGLQMIKADPICFRITSALHLRLMQDIPEQNGFDRKPGAYRRTPAFIGGENLSDARFGNESLDSL